MKNIKLILALIVSISLIFTLSSCDLFGTSGEGEGEGNSESGLLTFKEYLELPMEDQIAYFNTFEDMSAFSAWYNVAKAEYELLYGPIGGTPDGDINIDLGGDNNENEDGPSGSIDLGDKIPENDKTEDEKPEEKPDGDDNTGDGNGNEGDNPGDKPTDGDGTDGGNGNEGDKPSDTEGGDGDNSGDKPADGDNPGDKPADGDGTDDGNGNEGDKPSDTEGGEGDNPGDKPADGDGTDDGNGNEGDKPSDTEGGEGDNPGDKPADGDDTDDGNGNEGDKPADGDNSDDDGTTLLTWEEYLALSAEEQIDYFNSFEDITAFQEWRTAAIAAYNEANKGEDIPGDGNIDLGGE